MKLKSERSDKKFEVFLISILEVLMEKVDKMQNQIIAERNTNYQKNFKTIETRRTVRKIKNAFALLICTVDKPDEIISGFEDRATENKSYNFYI